MTALFTRKSNKKTATLSAAVNLTPRPHGSVRQREISTPHHRLLVAEGGKARYNNPALQLNAGRTKILKYVVYYYINPYPVMIANSIL